MDIRVLREKHYSFPYNFCDMYCCCYFGFFNEAVDLHWEKSNCNSDASYISMSIIVVENQSNQKFNSNLELKGFKSFLVYPRELSPDCN